jgi:hypothetical protein
MKGIPLFIEVSASRSRDDSHLLAGFPARRCKQTTHTEASSVCARVSNLGRSGGWVFGSDGRGCWATGAGFCDRLDHLGNSSSQHSAAHTLSRQFAVVNRRGWIGWLVCTLIADLPAEECPCGHPHPEASQGDVRVPLVHWAGNSARRQ